MKTLIKESQINQIVSNLAKKIAMEYKDRIFTLLAVMNGAAYLAVDLSRELGRLAIPHYFETVQCCSYKGQEQCETRIHVEDLKLQSKNILLFDELFDTGKTFYEIKNKITSLHSECEIKTCVVFIKDKVFDYPAPDYVGIKIHDVWVVGCGLDDNGLCRYVTSLYAVPKSRELSHLKGEHDKIFEDQEYYESLFEDGLYLGLP